MTVLEKITYEPSPTDPAGKTVFRQTAEMQARVCRWKSVGDKLESWSVERFKANAALGRQGFEHVLQALREQREQQSTVP